MNKGLEVIFENDEFIAVNKPPGMLSIPDREQSAPSLKDILAAKFGSILTVHRLDRETSGIILFAKNPVSHKYFCGQFEGRTVEKFYLGIVHGSVKTIKGTIDAPMMEHPLRLGEMVIHKNGKPSTTDYEVIEDFGKYSLVSFQIHTGRTHQVRVHAKSIGHPIACDPIYGDGKGIYLSSVKKNFKLSKHDEDERPLLNRVALHSHQLKFKDAMGNNFDLVAELPRDLKAVVQQLRKNS